MPAGFDSDKDNARFLNDIDRRVYYLLSVVLGSF